MKKMVPQSRAPYATFDWLIQRLSAVLMGLYVVALAITLLVLKLKTGATGYGLWAGTFALLWFKLATLVVFVALAYHAWVGVRDVLMDYVTAMSLRLFLYMVAVSWLIACLVWAIDILWRV